MAKSKEQKRQEALERLNVRIAERIEVGQKPTFSQQMERNALSSAKRVKSNDEKIIEKIFGPSDPVTGMIWANPLPDDFRPTPELTNIVSMLQIKKDRFVEVVVSLDTPEGYRYPTYQGSGDWMSQWVERHTGYVYHHGKHLFGSCATVVFSLPEESPQYNEDDRLIGGTTKEMYDRQYYDR